MSNLIRKQIIDKNGRVTTVRVNDDRRKRQTVEEIMNKKYARDIPSMPEPGRWFTNTRMAMDASNHANAAILFENDAIKYRREMRKTDRATYLDYVSDKVSEAKENISIAVERVSDANFNEVIAGVIHDCEHSLELWQNAQKAWENLETKANKRTRWKAAN